MGICYSLLRPMEGHVMSERPKRPSENYSNMLAAINVRKWMKESSKESSSIDNNIATDIDVSLPRKLQNQSS